VAFALAWALLFGYVLSLGRRFARLERDIQGMHGAP
jgi:CcmD family protein